MSQINANRTMLFIKSGVSLPVPPANFLETASPVMVSPAFALVPTNRMSGNMNSAIDEIDLCRTSVNFPIVHNMRTVGATNLNVPPEYGELLKMGGFKETILADKVVYLNELKTIPAGSALYYIDGNRLMFTNSLVSELDFDFTIGNPARINAKLRGFADSPEYTKEPNPLVVLSTEKDLFVSCIDAVTVGNTVIPCESAKITMNPIIQEIYTMGGAQGIKKNVITDYAIKIELSYFLDQAGINNEPADIISSAFKTIKIQMGTDHTQGIVNGETVIFDCSLARATVYSDTIDKDMLKRTVVYRIMNNSAGEAISITSGTVV